jgi:hypothetical protein
MQVVPSCPVYERLDPAKKAYADGKWSEPAAEPQVVGANSPVYVWVARKVPPGAVLFKVEARE